MKKSIIRILGFMVVLCLILKCWSDIFRFKFTDGTYICDKFYDLEDNTVDVLVMGTSHAFANFNTGTLWDEYGIASYDFACSNQPMWNTYYYLKEALKTQTPKLVVLEAMSTTFNYDYQEESGIIKNTFGLSWSKNRIDAISASSSSDEHTSYLLDYTHYHNRYKALAKEDFNENQGITMLEDWKGYYIKSSTAPFDYLDVSDIVDRAPLYEKTEKYYRKTIELAQENGIPMLIVVSPYASISYEEEMVFNSAGDIAAEYNVPFVNCNLLADEIGVDYKTEFADGHHLNHLGGQKFSKYIGKYIVENYDVPDHRGDDNYSSWDRNADCIRETIDNQCLKDSEDIKYIANTLQNDKYEVIFSADGNVDYNYDEIKTFINSYGLKDISTNGLCVINGENTIWSSNVRDEYYISTKNNDMHLMCNPIGDGRYSNSLIVNNETCSKVNNGINIVVYDKALDEIVTCIGLNTEGEFSIVK